MSVQGTHITPKLHLCPIRHLQNLETQKFVTELNKIFTKTSECLKPELTLCNKANAFFQ